MKRTRVIITTATVLVGMVLLAIGVLNSAAFQTWALRKVLADRDGLKIELTRAAFSFDSVSIEGLVVEKDGAVLRLPFVRANLPLYAAWRRRVDLDSLVARGWMLDLSHYLVAETGAKPTAQTPQDRAAAVFAGVFPLLQFPVDLSVGKVDLDGEVLFPADRPGQMVRARVGLSGGGLGVGKEGRVLLELTGDMGEGVPVRDLKLRSQLLIGMDTPRTISEVSCEMQADARGPQFPEGARLQLFSKAWRSQGTEAYSLELKREQVAVLSLEAQWNKPNGALEGRWVVKASDVDFAPFVLGHALPLFELEGKGLFAVVLPRETLQLTGNLSTRADRLGVLDGRLAGFGAVSTQASFDLVSAKEYLRVRRFNVAVSASEAVAEIEALQGFELQYKGAEIKLSDPAKQLLRVHASALPVAWLAAFMPQGSELKGGVLKGEWTWAAHAGGFSLLSTREAQVDGVSFSRGGQTWVEGLDISANFRVDYTAAGWQVDLAGLKLQRERQNVADFHLKLGQRKGEAQPIMLQGGGQLALPGLLAQPLCHAFSSLEAGNVNLEFQGSLAETSEVHVKLQAEAMRRAGLALPAVSLELRGTLARDGSFSFTAPVQLDNERLGRASDLSLEGTVQVARLPLKIEGKLLGRVVSLEDIQMLTTLLQPQAGARAVESSSSAAQRLFPAASPFGQVAVPLAKTPVPDTVAAWSVVEGRIQMTVGKLVLNSSCELAEVKANLEFSPEAFRIDQLKARGDNSTALSLDASIYFAPGETPYTMQAQFKANAFEVSGFTSSKDAFSPTLTTKFDISSKLKGEGLTLSDLFEHSTGSFQLLSRGGKCRLLRSDITEFLQGKSSLGNLFMGSLGSLLSSKSDREAEAREGAKLNEYSKIAMELATYFAEIPFDQLSVSLVRDSEMNLKLQDFALISPMLRLTGAGAITHQAGKPFADQPMELQLQLAARGRIAELFAKANMLLATKDNLGYMALNQPVKLRGTLGRPDSSEFKELLRKVTQQKAEAFLERLIGGGR